MLFASNHDQHSHWQQIKPLHKRTCAHHFGRFGTRERTSILQTPLAPAILARDGCLCQYRLMSMSKNKISGGVVHELPEDLRNTLAADAESLAAWEALTPLARNEWICWTISVKKPETRQQHVERVRTELKEGMRRPCCWLGCIHRTDKPISPSVQYVLSKRSKRSS
jgi:Bacteriocin-protection, YdeI or OmpD-Associated